MTPEKPALGLLGRVDGIDVSAVQLSVDYKKVAAAGFRFALVKVSEGVGYTDPLALRHLTRFRSEGMIAIPYAFLRPSQGRPRDQAQRLWDSMGDIAPGRLALDLETRLEQMNNEFLIDFAEECVEACEELELLSPILYTYPDFARHLQPELSRSKLARCPLWIASFPYEPWAPTETDQPHVPAPWSAWSLWQYGGNSAFRVPGIPMACDRDLFRGSVDDLREFVGLPA